MSASSELSPLPKMSKLRQDWGRIYGYKPPSRARREFLQLAIEWHRQAKQQGGMQRADREAISALIDTMKEGSIPKAPATRNDLTPGAVLMREWNGQHYEVRVTDEGFSFAGKTWRSLSQIAREITGARWNGPAFFGLRSKRKAVAS